MSSSDDEANAGGVVTTRSQAQAAQQRLEAGEAGRLPVGPAAESQARATPGEEETAEPTPATLIRNETHGDGPKPFVASDVTRSTVKWSDESEKCEYQLMRDIVWGDINSEMVTSLNDDVKGEIHRTFSSIEGSLNTPVKGSRLIQELKQLERVITHAWEVHRDRLRMEEENEERRLRMEKDIQERRLRMEEDIQERRLRMEKDIQERRLRMEKENWKSQLIDAIQSVPEVPMDIPSDNASPDQIVEKIEGIRTYGAENAYYTQAFTDAFKNTRFALAVENAAAAAARKYEHPAHNLPGCILNDPPELLEKVIERRRLIWNEMCESVLNHEATEEWKSDGVGRILKKSQAGLKDSSENPLTLEEMVKQARPKKPNDEVRSVQKFREAIEKALEATKRSP